MEKQAIVRALLKHEDEFRAVLKILNVSGGADIDFRLTAEGIAVDVFDRSKSDIVFHAELIVECIDNDNKSEEATVCG